MSADGMIKLEFFGPSFEKLFKEKDILELDSVLGLDANLTRSCHEWLMESVGEGNFFYVVHLKPGIATFYFKNNADAVLFKMAKL